MSLQPGEGRGAVSTALRLLLMLRGAVEATLFWIGALLLASTTIVVGLQVFFRYVLNDSLTWSDEGSRLLLVWLVCLGAGLASFRGQHLRVSILEDRLSETRRRLVRLAVAALIVWFMWVMIDGNADVIDVRSSIPFTSLHLSSKYLSYAVTVGAVLIMIGSLVDLLAPREQDESRSWN